MEELAALAPRMLRRVTRLILNGACLKGALAPWPYDLRCVALRRVLLRAVNRLGSVGAAEALCRVLEQLSSELRVLQLRSSSFAARALGATCTCAADDVWFRVVSLIWMALAAAAPSRRQQSRPSRRGDSCRRAWPAVEAAGAGSLENVRACGPVASEGRSDWSLVFCVRVGRVCVQIMGSVMWVWQRLPVCLASYRSCGTCFLAVRLRYVLASLRRHSGCGGGT